MFKINKILYFCLLISIIFLQGAKFVIDPTKNAVMHNEKGVRFLEDGYYAAAANEFKIAISLRPNTAASATFYNNLGRTYMYLHRYDWATPNFKKAIELNPNFLEYYRNLIKSFKARNILTKEVAKHIQILKKDRSNSESWLMLGLMYVELDYQNDAKLCLSEFKKLEPDLVISQGITIILNELENTY